VALLARLAYRTFPPLRNPLFFFFPSLLLWVCLHLRLLFPVSSETDARVLHRCPFTKRRHPMTGEVLVFSNGAPRRKLGRLKCRFLRHCPPQTPPHGVMRVFQSSLIPRQGHFPSPIGLVLYPISVLLLGSRPGREAPPPSLRARSTDFYKSLALCVPLRLRPPCSSCIW